MQLHQKKKKKSPETWCFFGGKKGDTSLVDSAENELCIQTSASGIEWSQQEEDGYPAKARFNEAGRNSQGFFLHTQALVSTTTTALFMPRKKLEREVYRAEKKKGGEGEFLSSMDILGEGSSQRLAKKFAAAFVFSRASKRAR
jgi:hypothetical protein